MAEKYNPQAIEPHWQARWEAQQLYRAQVDWSKPKHYALTMLPYPSGDLHIGHWFAMTPSDARARYMRMRGYNVLFPMGFDAFGLPAENAAIQRNIHPKTWTYANIERMRQQLRSMGAMFDWQREAVSCDPEYYKWTEWFFKIFYDNELAYRGEALVNWSPTLQTVLANEQVIDGKDERTGQPVIQKMMTQWFFRYSRYTEELLKYDGLDWPEPVRVMQTHWIGRSEGAKVIFRTEQGDPIEIFTTRPDTLWGATFMVLAPEHPLVKKVTGEAQRAAVDAYVAQTARATEIERTTEGREKTGVFTGGHAVNPVNGERIPIWIADYVLSTYGSGAIMAVPAHDQRDFEFARRFGLEIRVVIQPEGEALDGATMPAAYAGAGVMVHSGPFDGTQATEDKGRKNPAIAAVIDWLERQGIGRESVNYRLRDWLISRQRYWGAPIPIIYKQDGTMESVSEEQLPVRLPDDVEFMPTGQSPLRFHAGFLNTTAADGTPATRETDTMDTFMCSSWYQYRYLSPHYSAAPFDPEEAAYWLPVDVYTGGAEHSTLHLLYTRFFTKAMRDLGVFDATAAAMRRHGRNPDGAFDEPMRMLRNQGQVLGEERPGHIIRATGRWEGSKLFADAVTVIEAGEPRVDAEGVVGEILRRTENILNVDVGGGETRVVEVPHSAAVTIPGIAGPGNVNQLRHHLDIQRMSKSKGNVVNPDELVARYGADTVRGYLMFAFDWEKGGPWNSQGVEGVYRFVHRIWALLTEEPETRATGEPTDEAIRSLRRVTHQMIQRVTQNIEAFKFNTMISTLMEFSNALGKAKETAVYGTAAWNEATDALLLLLAPAMPHISEELWQRRHPGPSVHLQAWPQFDAEAAKAETVTVVVQINGKMRDKVELPADVSEADAQAAALATDGARRYVDGKQVVKVIYVPGKLVNVVVR